MKMVLKIKAMVHILVRVLQLKRLGPFDSNFTHTFLWVFATWWKDRTFRIGLSALTAVRIWMKMVLKIKAKLHNLVIFPHSKQKRAKWWIFSQNSVFSAVIQLKRLGRFDSNFAHTLLWVLHTWREPVRMCLYSLQAYLSVKSSHLNDYEHFPWNRQRSLALQTEYW